MAADPLIPDPLVHDAVIGFAEMLALLGRHAGTQVRSAGLIGARLPAAVGSPWYDAVVVPPGVAPPADSADLPTAVWSLAETMTGRVIGPTMPCMVLELAAALPAPPLPAGLAAVTPDFASLGALNDRAYGSAPLLEHIAPRLDDPRLARFGLAAAGRLVCGLVTLTLGDNLCIHYVATDPGWRRRGLALALLGRVLAGCDGRIATLQASADGLPVYQRLGFRVVTTLHGFIRPEIAAKAMLS